MNNYITIINEYYEYKYDINIINMILIILI